MESGILVNLANPGLRTIFVFTQPSRDSRLAEALRLWSDGAAYCSRDLAVDSPVASSVHLEHVLPMFAPDCSCCDPARLQSRAALVVGNIDCREIRCNPYAEPHVYCTVKSPYANLI